MKRVIIVFGVVGAIFLIVYMGVMVTKTWFTDRAAREQVSRPYRLPASPPMTEDARLEMLKVVERTLRKMDSLRDDVEGRVIYDSICLMRPGLLDSLHEVERMFRNY